MSKPHDEIIPADDAAKKPPALLPLRDGTTLDLTAFSEEQAEYLRTKWAEGAIDTAKRAADIAVDAMALKRKLDDMADATAGLSETGTAVTITGKQKDNLGETEIVMGNTEAAKRGLSHSSHRENTLLQMFFGLIVLIIIAVVLVKVLQ